VCDAANLAATGTPITLPNTTLTSARGLVLYKPFTDEFGPSYATFRFRLMDPDDGSILSDEATVTISIRAQNDAPAARVAHGVAPTLPANAAPQHLTFVLASSDVDENATNTRAYAPSFAPHPFARITRFPSAGRLHQLRANGSPGGALDSTVTSVPTASSWVSGWGSHSARTLHCIRSLFSLWRVLATCGTT
jgi:hypothetical protein